MKNIRDYKAEKYNTNEYTEVESNIYKTMVAPTTRSLIGISEEEYEMINGLEEWNNKKEYKYFYYITYNGKKYYKHKDVDEDIIWTDEDPKEVYVTSLMFELEKEYGEGLNASDGLEYPIYDILYEFGVYISDPYDELNTNDSKVGYREFASAYIDDIRKLRSIIGKHVYIKDEGDRVLLVIDN